MGPIDRDFLNRCRLRKERKFQFLIEIFILVIWRPLKITSGGPWPPWPLCHHATGTNHVYYGR